MKKLILSFLILTSVKFASAQLEVEPPVNIGDVAYDPYSYPPTSGAKDKTMWYEHLIKDVVRDADMIFEGRILTDSIYDEGIYKYTYHHILILKQFKGDFKSDTIAVATGRLMMKDNIVIYSAMYGTKGDEAVFLVKNYDNILHELYNNRSGFLTVCDKKNIDKYVYEPLEAAIGHPYVDVHPNTCATQQKPRK